MTKGVQDLMIAVERARDEFHAAIFERRDVDAVAALITDDCAYETVPVVGVTGRDALVHHLARSVIPHLPGDLAFRRLSRTGDRWRVAQEDVVTFTHDRELPWLLPGLAPTGRRAEVLAVSITRVQRRLIAQHRVLWDLTTLTSQLRGVARTR